MRRERETNIGKENNNGNKSKYRIFFASEMKPIIMVFNVYDLPLKFSVESIGSVCACA